MPLSSSESVSLGAQIPLGHSPCRKEGGKGGREEGRYGRGLGAGGFGCCKYSLSHLGGGYTDIYFTLVFVAYSIFMQFLA